MVCWALPGPVGAAAAGAASPMIAAATPLTIAAANPNFFIFLYLFHFTSRLLNRLVSGLIPVARMAVTPLTAEGLARCSHLEIGIGVSSGQFVDDLATIEFMFEENLGVGANRALRHQAGTAGSDP